MHSKSLWLSFVIVAVAIGGAIPVLFNPLFYFVDDTESGAIGQWYEIGNRLLAWDWSLINPTVWQSGNYIAEGAWGIFSPVLWLIGVGSHVLDDVVAYITIVKVAFMVIAACGVWLLARTFGASVPWATVVAIAAPLTGFTLYMDAASWANGFMAWSMWPFAWALARRTIFEAKSPLLAALACFGVIGIGYVHATIMLAVVLGASIVEAAIRRHRPSIIRALAVSFIAGAFAVVVHLPTLLTAPVTGRSSGIYNTGLLTVDFGGLATSSIPVGLTQTDLFGTPFPNAPLMYIAWFLPLLAFVEWRSLVALLKRRTSLLIVLAVALVLVLLPSDFGPLRFPIRLMPYFSVGILLIAAIGFSLAIPAFLARRRLYGAWGIVAAAMFLSWTVSPSHWKTILLTGVITALSLFVIFQLLTAKRVFSWSADGATPGNSPRRIALACALVSVVTLIMLVPQHYTAHSSPLKRYGVPTSLAQLQTPLSLARGDVIVVGGVSNGPANAGVWNETLVGNLHYIPQATVQNAYSAVYYPAYQNTLCMAYNGFTCPELYLRLFAPLPDTGELLVDALGVSSVQSIKLTVPKEIWSVVPSGWTVVEDTKFTRLMVRDQPVPGAGRVVWQSDGTKVTVLKSDSMGVQFTVDSVGPDGGTIALSRLGWPGYAAEGAATVMASPMDGFLMGVELDAASKGTVVTVRFISVGWPAQSLAGALILALLMLWGLMRHTGIGRASNRLGMYSRLSRSVREENQIV